MFYTVRISILVDPPFLPFVIFHIVYSSYRFIFMKACYECVVSLLLWCRYLMHPIIITSLGYTLDSILFQWICWPFTSYCKSLVMVFSICLFVFNWEMPTSLCFLYSVSLVVICDWLIISNHTGLYSSHYPLTVFHSRRCIANMH